MDHHMGEAYRLITDLTIEDGEVILGHGSSSFADQQRIGGTLASAKFIRCVGEGWKGKPIPRLLCLRVLANLGG